MPADGLCPICHEESVPIQPVSNWGEMRCCMSCKLAFASPMTLPEPPESLYNKAYQGLSENPGMKQYNQRILLREQWKKGNIDPERALSWCAAHTEAMGWLKNNIPAGSVVLDMGCGLGYWLSALNKNGFTPIGLDVAKEVVDILTNEGFEIWHGMVDSVPYNWEQPAVCTSFFMLQHLSDPVSFLKAIRSKFPKAVLLIAVWNRFPSPPKLSAASLPPRTLTWWGPHSLRKALEQAGYQVDFVSQLLEHYEFAMPRITQRRFSDLILSSRHYRLFSIYQAAKPKIFWPWKFWKRLRGKSSSVLALGKPYEAAPI